MAIGKMAIGKDDLGHSNVVQLDTVTRLDLPVERVIEGARIRDLDGIVVLGFDKDGEEYFASSYADGGTALWLIERLKLRLLGIG